MLFSLFMLKWDSREVSRHGVEWRECVFQSGGAWPEVGGHFNGQGTPQRLAMPDGGETFTWWARSEACRSHCKDSQQLEAQCHGDETSVGDDGEAPREDSVQRSPVFRAEDFVWEVEAPGWHHNAVWGGMVDQIYVRPCQTVDIQTEATSRNLDCRLITELCIFFTAIVFWLTNSNQCCFLDCCVFLQKSTLRNFLVGHHNQ